MIAELCVVLSPLDWYNKVMGKHWTVSDEGRENIRRAKIGELNPNWIGDKVQYAGLHGWVRRRIPKPEFCVDCGIRPALDLANKGIYDRNLDNWEYLCRHCHMVKDGRMDLIHSKEVTQKIAKSLMGHKRFYKGDKRNKEEEG